MQDLDGEALLLSGSGEGNLLFGVLQYSGEDNWWYKREWTVFAVANSIR
jgi:hypothetical protein